MFASWLTAYRGRKEDRGRERQRQEVNRKREQDTADEKVDRNMVLCQGSFSFALIYSSTTKILNNKALY